MALLAGMAALIIFAICVVRFTGGAKEEIEETPNRMVSLGKRLDNGTKLQFKFDLGCHMLFAGETGFGKSNEINYLISQLASYAEVQFMIASGKSGTDFLHWLPRASTIAIGPNATDKMVDSAIGILETRYAVLMPGGDVDTAEGMHSLMTAQRKVTITNELPLIAVIVDEFVEYMNAPDGAKRARKLHRIATTGRAVGIVLILATQRPSQWSSPTDIRENLPYHVSFRLDKYGTDMIFGKGAMNNVSLDRLGIPGYGYAIVPGELDPVPFIAPEVSEAYCGGIAWESARLRRSLDKSKHLIKDI